MVKMILRKAIRFASQVILVSIILTAYVSKLTAGEIWTPLVKGELYSEPKPILLEESPRGLLIKWELKGYFSENINTPQGEFTRIRFNQYPGISASPAGFPQLPMLTAMIWVPEGYSAQARVEKVEWASAGTAKVYPRQYPTRDNGQGAEDFIFNSQVYDQKVYFPQNLAQSGSPQGWGGIPVTAVSATPFRYIPASGELEVAHQIIVRVDFLPDGGISPVKSHRPNPQMEKLQRSVLLNPPPFENQPLEANENDPVRMLVVLYEEAMEIMLPLIQFHHNTGLRTETWVVNRDDVADPEVIKERLTGWFVEGLQYVLFVGDGHRQNWHIPLVFWDPRDPGWQDDEETGTPSDRWFTCLDGPDQDGFDDHLPELSIGRLVYRIDHLEELAIQVDKLMDYMTWSFAEPRRDWLGNCVLVADDYIFNDDLGPEFRFCKERIADFNYTFTAPEFIRIFGNVQGNTNQTIINQINGGGVGIFNYRGHGDWNQTDDWNLINENINSAFVNRLVNRNSPFIYISSACLTSDIYNHLANCLTENFQLRNGGSVCTQGAIFETYTEGNSFYDEQIFQNWFDQGIYSIGLADVGAVSDMVLHYDQTPWPVVGRLNTRSYIWLGDPALEIRQDAVELRVDAPELIPFRTRSVAFTVTDQDGSGVEAARVCVHTDDNEVYLTQETDGRGRAVIFFDPLIEEALMLNWGVYNRNAIPAFGGILVAEGFGILEGQVTDFGDGHPVEGAEIRLLRFDLADVSEVQGNYRIEGIPAGEYEIQVSAPGYLNQSAIVQIVDDQVTRRDFALRFALLEVAPSRIRQHVDNGQEGVINLSLNNVGNGELTWSASLSYPGEGAPFALLDSDDLAGVVNDNRLAGVIFVNDHYYICGANRLADPNYIYVLNRNLQLVNRFEQPVELAGMGMHDLAWDGEFLYGSSNRFIYQFTPEGEFRDIWQGPYNPNVALAYDGEGQFWVGNNRSNLIRIDRQGNQTGAINNSLIVRALAWHPADPEGFNLFLWVRGDNNMVQLHQANPATGEVRLVCQLTLDDGDLPLDGLCLTSDYIPASWTIIGMVSQPNECWLRHWVLRYYRGWLALEPAEGMILPGESQDLALSYQTEGFAHDQELNANIEISNNGRVPQIVVSLRLSVGNVGVEPSEMKIQPDRFSLAEAFPNPFNSTAQVRVDMPQAGDLRVEAFDLTGRRQAVLTEGWQGPGAHWFTLNGEGLPSGIYIIQATSQSERSSLKVALLR